MHSNSPLKAFLIAFASLFAIALIWNGFLHLVLLVEINASVKHLHRPDIADKMWLSMVLTAGIVALFLVGYQRFVRNHSIREGAGYGLFFAAIAGLLVDINQYLLYPIPFKAVALWFIGGLVEFTLYGAVTSKLMSSFDSRSPRTGAKA